MTSPSPSPNPRRRRVVVAIAFLAIGLCWWFWPRVDQRFVGKWGFPSYAGSGSLEAVPEIRVLILDANGLGESVLLASRDERFQWWVRETPDGTRLIMQFPSDRATALVWYEYVLAVFTGASYPREVVAWDAKVKDDSLTIHGRGNLRLGLVRVH